MKKNKVKYHHCLLLLVFVFVKSSQAQESNSSLSHQLWVDYNLKKEISNKLDYKGAYGLRSVQPHNWSRFWVRQLVSFKWDRKVLKLARFKERFDVGLDVFFTDNFYEVNTFEITPFQAYSLIIPNHDKVKMRHYIKLEERFEFDTKELNSKLGIRLSYQIAGVVNFKGNIWKYGKGFYLPISAKFFWNLIGTRQFNDNLRITPGLGYKVSREWNIAFLIGYSYTRDEVNESFHSNDINYRMRIYHTLKNKSED